MSNVSSDGAQLDRSALLPGGKPPADLVPARPERIVPLAGDCSFFSRTVNGLLVFSVGPVRSDGKRLIAVLVPRMPEEWRGRLGPGKEIRLFPENATLYESLGVLIAVRGALVYQVR